MWQDFYDSFVLNFIKDDRWKYLTNGLAVTLKLTFFAVLLGLVIGFFIAMVLLLLLCDLVYGRAEGVYRKKLRPLLKNLL